MWWDVARLHLEGLRRDAGCAGARERRAVRLGRPGAPTRAWRALAERAGFRMINLGCRLARPALVARARSGM